MRAIGSGDSCSQSDYPTISKFSCCSSRSFPTYNKICSSSLSEKIEKKKRELGDRWVGRVTLASAMALHQCALLIINLSFDLDAAFEESCQRKKRTESKTCLYERTRCVRKNDSIFLKHVCMYELDV